MLPAIALLLVTQQTPEACLPGKAWTRYSTPEEAGFSAEKLQEAKAYYDTLGAAAALTIYRGGIVAAWGDIEHRYMCHSVRKSFLSGLFGIHVDRGVFDLDWTLAELGIDDQEPALSTTEKTATVRDLLQARSGVYHPAAYQPAEHPKPPRGSYLPGTHWCYNNWDFNTLLTIFEQETGTKIFDEFEKRFAGPLGMQDYRPSDGEYFYERDKSIHPAYPFRMSARDMARFGLLYLNRGRWGDRQILSEDWVAESTRSYSDARRNDGYGYMWWISGEEPFAKLGMYSARGHRGHSLDVVPGADLVFVFRVNTFEPENRVGSKERHDLLRMILDARVD